ncbi:peptidoglycan D,D-transpeptidase FtsI family protein [Alkalihalobacterium chitinilyticum]|uniref:serine-type D-Ala-D-Ala carboxypeptidase n=1 Tax=Alkalihalobacterium chitinilyticum TaxID=2980103 RepID=A0ABT5VER0_9BACI|nr:penicillin-binding protein 2 [Alkalihalobacterium chitinilyticum]MDE5413943.1 penicillin-binding protein 2 [Alkalihalobacterium chitinilyticum]
MTNHKKKKNHVPARLNLLFFAVFILFSALILRLGMVQIVQGEDFTRDLERTSNVTTRIDAPRGIMYDRNGTIVVDNERQFSLTYTQPPRPSEQEKLEVAEKLTNFIELDTSSITERDMKDYWILTRREQALDKVSSEERKDLGNNEEYQLTLDRITEEDLAEITEEEKKVLAIKREMDRGFALSPQRIKQGLTKEEAHGIIEHLPDLPGVEILLDSTRKYVFDDTFKSFFGRTGSIPRESLDFYLSRGYERSDIVGTSFLELQYEQALRGEKAVVENITSRGSVIGTSLDKIGQRGYDLVLAMDMELQKQVEEVLKREVDKNRGAFLRTPSAYVVMMDPKTGEIYAMAGYEGNDFDHFGVVNKAFEMGSTVKGATVLAGLHAGVIGPNTIFYDAPITVSGQPFRSVTTMGNINSLTALERSSNIYMAHIVMNMAGYNYSTKCCFRDMPGAFQNFRNYLNQFGLGVETGIDLPSEGIGLKGDNNLPGSLINLSYGQYDTYTPLQLAQYVSTIANDGYRMQPRLVKEIREPSSTKDDLGRVITQFQPSIMNRVEMSDEHIRHVQRGFRQVVTGSRGTGRHFANKPYQLAGKTGTAQVLNNQGNNQTYVAYAPYENPKVAVSIVVPNVNRNTNATISRNILEGVMDAFFELEEKRQNPSFNLPAEEDVED